MRHRIGTGLGVSFCRCSGLYLGRSSVRNLLTHLVRFPGDRCMVQGGTKSSSQMEFPELEK